MTKIQANSHGDAGISPVPTGDPFPAKSDGISHACGSEEARLFLDAQKIFKEDFFGLYDMDETFIRVLIETSLKPELTSDLFKRLPSTCGVIQWSHFPDPKAITRAGEPVTGFAYKAFKSHWEIWSRTSAGWSCLLNLASGMSLHVVSTLHGQSELIRAAFNTMLYLCSLKPDRGSLFIQKCPDSPNDMRHVSVGVSSGAFIRKLKSSSRRCPEITGEWFPVAVGDPEMAKFKLHWRMLSDFDSLSACSSSRLLVCA